MLLFYADSTRIFRMELQILPGKVGWPMRYPNDISTFVVKKARARSLAVDAVTRKVLWNDRVRGTFYRCNFDGSGTEELFRFTIFAQVNGLIVDPISGQLYLTLNDVVLRSDMSGKNIKIVHTERYSNPFRLALSYDNE